MTDHGLTLDGPYEPDWWCLTHGTSGQTGTTCPHCDPRDEGTR